MGRALGILAIGLVVFGTTTLAALEGHEVVVLHTTGASGKARATRTWIAEADGGLWVEAANADRPFLHDLRVNRIVTLARAGQRLTCRASVLPNPDGHRKIRQLLAERYGWADWWIGWLADTTGSLAVRLDCEG